MLNATRTLAILAALSLPAAAVAAPPGGNPFLPKSDTARPVRPMPTPPAPRVTPVPPGARSVGTINGTRVYFNSEENRYVFQADPHAQDTLPAPSR